MIKLFSYANINLDMRKDLLILAGETIALTLLVWLPHLLSLPNFFGLNFSNGFATIYRNFDGIEYIVIAKSLYQPSQIALLPQSLPDIYYAAHFPGYALAILAFAPLLGFLKSMLFTSVLFTILSVWAFYMLVRDFKLTNYPLWLSSLFLVLPARWLVVHSVGSAEPMFVFFIIMAIYCFMKNQILAAALFGTLAQFTRPPGALLLVALGLYIIWQHRLKLTAYFRYLPLSLMLLTLLGIFYWYGLAYGDFWAYFHTGDNIHLTFPPYQVFDKHQFWVGEIWLEDIIYIFGIGFLGGLLLWKKKLYPMAFFVLTYLVASTMVVHRDIARYTLPVFPFLLVAYENLLTSKEFRIVAAILILGIYLYTQNFLIENVAPIPNLSPFN